MSQATLEPPKPGRNPSRPKADLTQGPIGRHIARMALPMLIGMSAHLFLNLIDGILVGRLGINESLAVLNYGFPYFYLVFAFFNGVATGTTSTLARLLGAQEEGKAQNTLSQVVWISLGLFLLMMALTPILLPAYLNLQEAEPAGAILATQYLLYMFMGLPFTILALLLGGGLRAEGNMRAIMNAMLISTLANLAMAPFLIFADFRLFGMDWQGVGLGVRGAGIATALANLLSALLIGRMFFSKHTRLKLVYWPRWNDLSGVRSTFAVGFPSIVSQALIGLSLIILTRTAVEYGPHAVAAVGIGARLDVLAVFPALSIMIAVLSLVGQNSGAKRYDRVAETVRLGLITGFIVLSAIGLLVFFFRGALIGLFHPEPETYLSAHHFVKYLALGYGFVGVSIVSSGAFQGLGRGMPFLIINVLRQVFLLGPFAFFFSVGFGEKGIHYAPIAAAAITATVAVVWIVRTTHRLALTTEKT